jgi:hypothetical protein
MKPPGLKSWIRLLIRYWALISIIVCLELKYMDSSWAGLPGFLFTLPLSVLVVTGYFLAAYAKEVHGYNITITSSHTEYGFLICAFLNGFIFYPAYLWWLRRRKSKAPLPPPPLPPDFKA